MTYRVIGCMSGSSMDGLDIAYCSFHEVGGNWSFTIEATACADFPEEWKKTLVSLTELNAKELLRTHCRFGHWMGQTIHAFIRSHHLEHKVHFITSHGHTVFHEPQHGMTFQMGDGAAIAAETELPVISDLRNLDIALGGQGAPIVPIGEKYLWNEYPYFLNLGGISNLTMNRLSQHVAFDVCPANRVLNALANQAGKIFDEGGQLARTGSIHTELLKELNRLEYYKLPFPKSLSNEFGLETVLTLIQYFSISLEDKLRTMVEHIVQQISAVLPVHEEEVKLMATGGGAMNTFLMEQLSHTLQQKNIKVYIPKSEVVEFKEAIVMAFIGVLRWREENNVLSSVTGASRSSIGGALWMGQN